MGGGSGWLGLRVGCGLNQRITHLIPKGFSYSIHFPKIYDYATGHDDQGLKDFTPLGGYWCWLGVCDANQLGLAIPPILKLAALEKANRYRSRQLEPKGLNPPRGIGSGWVVLDANH